MTNYIATKKEFKTLESEGNSEIIEIDGEIYKADCDKEDPEYINDGVLNLSFYHLKGEDGENSPKYFLAFDKRDDVEDPQEWSDEYDVDHMYVLELN